jgi:hypothetical protein
MVYGLTQVGYTTHFTYTSSDLITGDAFRKAWLKTGKLYPCVGFCDNGDGGRLQVQIVLPKSEGQIFKYKGPYTAPMPQSE